jgi:hypothetical protein
MTDEELNTCGLAGSNGSECFISGSCQRLFTYDIDSVLCSSRDERCMGMRWCADVDDIDHANEAVEVVSNERPVFRGELRRSLTIRIEHGNDAVGGRFPRIGMDSCHVPRTNDADPETHFTPPWVIPLSICLEKMT